MHPEQLGPYRIVSRLGRGGMGAVYEATDEAGRHVAVKMLAAHLADDPGLRRRFDAEIATLKTLRHPGIVQLLAFGEEDDQPYFAMELVPGRSLEQLLRTGRRFTWQETVALALAVARALKVAHDHGVVHRDLKPANILVADGPDADLGSRVRLADFGIAKLFGSAAHTALGNVVGTAEYMAPEQAAGGHVDQRVDIYALGLVMFAMLAGRPPFTGGQAAEIIRRQQHERPPRVTEAGADVPYELEMLVDRMLSKEPAGRPASALALGRLLEAVETMHRGAPAADDTGPLTELPLPTPADKARDGVDLYAPTRDVARPATAPPAAAAGAKRTHAATGATPGSPTKPVDADSATGVGGDAASATVVERPARTRFTTVAELDRVAGERLARDRARAQRWQAAAVIATLALLAGIGYLLFKRPSADELFARIESAQVAAAAGGDLRDALPTLEAFLARFPADPRAAQVRSLGRTLALDGLERRARRRPLGTTAPAPIERDYRSAMEREAESPSACRDALEALVALHEASATPPASPAARPQDDPTLWLDLARRQIDRLQPLAAREQAEDAARLAEILRQAADLAAEAGTAAPERGAELLGRRRDLLQGVVDLYATRPHAAAAVAAARELLNTP